MARVRTEVGSGGVAFVCVAALLATAAVYVQANLLFWALGLMAGALVVSLGLAFLSLRGVTIQRLEPTPGVVGEKLVLRYQLHNAKRWLPAFNLVVQETWGRDRWWRAGWRYSGPIAERPARLVGRPHGWLMHLGPGQTALAEAPCWPRRRGVLELECVVLSTSFPFGLLRRVMRVSQESRVLVYPRLYRIDRALWRRLNAADPAGHLHAELAGAGEEFFGLRPYRPGDRLRMIDWRHSAHTGQLIAREMTQASPPRLLLVLDLADLTSNGAPLDAGSLDQGGPSPARLPPRLAGPADHPAPLDLPRGGGDHCQPLPAEPLERAVSLAASIICGAHAQGYQVGLIVNGVECPTFRIHHSLPHRTRMLEALALLDAARRRVASVNFAGEAAVVIRPTPAAVRPDERGEPLAASAEPNGASTAGPSSLGAGRRALVLETARLGEYVLETAGGPSELLSRTPPSASRRRQPRGAEAWT